MKEVADVQQFAPTLSRFTNLNTLELSGIHFYNNEVQAVLRTILSSWTPSKHDQDLVLNFPFLSNLTRKRWLGSMRSIGGFVKEFYSGMHVGSINQFSVANNTHLV